jgi:DNA polymerase-1
VFIDKDNVTAFKAQFEHEERELRAKLEAELGGTPASDRDDEELILEGTGSTKSLREALLKVGVPLTERTESGELATNKNVLGTLAPDYPVIADLFEWRRVKRFLTTYIGPMVGRDVLHTDFQPQEAWTGRMSSRRPNMQNWPQRAGKEVRNVLRARPGYVLAVADYAQMEFMIIARYMNDPGLIESINEGLDGNAYTASLIWGHDPNYWSKDGPHAEGEQSRKTARHTLYATAYGAGACRVTQQLPFLDRGPYLEPTETPDFLRNRDTGALVPTKAWKNSRWPRPGWQCEEARALQLKIKAGLPGYKNLLARLGRKIDQVGYLNTIYGRRNPVSPDKKYVAVAAIVQGSGADILKLAAVGARRPLEELGATIVMFTHDELVAEVPIEHGEEGLRRLVDAMENAYPEHNPRLRASGHLVTHYGEE